MAIFPLLAKIALVTVTTGVAGSAVAVPFVMHKMGGDIVRKPLNKETLDGFVKNKGYKECWSFLSTKDSLSLLFVCTKADTQMPSDTHGDDEIFYYWNGNSFREAISLTSKLSVPKRAQIFLENGWKGEIEIEDNEIALIDSKLINLKEHCEIQPAGVLTAESNKKLNCHNSDQEEMTDTDSHTFISNTFSLKKYDFDSQGAS